MASKLEGGLWELKMMLPEHREALERYAESINYRERIELDEQELEQISRALHQSMKFNLPLTVKLYDPVEELQVVGVVKNISRLHGQFKVEDDWFNIEDIEGVVMQYEAYE